MQCSETADRISFQMNSSAMSSPLPLSSTVPQSTSQSPTSSKKSISWNSRLAAVHFIEPITAANGHNLWWTGNDIRETRKQCEAIVHCMDHDGVVTTRNENDDSYGQRPGSSESSMALASSSHRKTISRTTQCLRGVLKEQAYQQDQSIQDEEMIAKLYINLCGSASREAHLRGVEDEEAARKLYKQYVEECGGCPLLCRWIRARHRPRELCNLPNTATGRTA